MPERPACARRRLLRTLGSGRHEIVQLKEEAEGLSPHHRRVTLSFDDEHVLGGSFDDSRFSQSLEFRGDFSLRGERSRQQSETQ
jgi:hypothetical protein